MAHQRQAEFPGRCIQQLADRSERQAELLQQKQSLERGELLRIVVAITRADIDVRRPEQTLCFVVPQGPNADFGEPRKVADANHAVILKSAAAAESIRAGCGSGRLALVDGSATIRSWAEQEQVTTM